MADPFTARGRAGRSRARRSRWALLVLVALVVLVVYLVAFSPALVVREVVVTGADEQVARMAREHADVGVGRPLARVDTEAVGERVAADSRLESVEVTRRWPSTISIELTLRSARAVLSQPGEQPMLVDRSGVAYQAVAQRPDDLPQISAPPGAVAEASVAGALQARSALDDSTRDQVSSLEVTADGDLRFDIGALTVLWGQPEEVEAKAAAVEALLSQEGIYPDEERSLTLDVTAPQTPVVSGLSPAPPD